MNERWNELNEVIVFVLHANIQNYYKVERFKQIFCYNPYSSVAMCTGLCLRHLENS